MMKITDTIKYKKGQELHLDDIYSVQALAEGDWWDYCGTESGDAIVITQDIEIKITWKKG